MSNMLSSVTNMKDLIDMYGDIPGVTLDMYPIAYLVFGHRGNNVADQLVARVMKKPHAPKASTMFLDLQGEDIFAEESEAHRELWDFLLKRSVRTIIYESEGKLVCWPIRPENPAKQGK